MENYTLFVMPQWLYAPKLPRNYTPGILITALNFFTSPHYPAAPSNLLTIRRLCLIIAVKKKKRFPAIYKGRERIGGKFFIIFSQ